MASVRGLSPNSSELYGVGETFTRWCTAEREDLAATVRLFDFEQRAGDVVYVPAAHSHAVYNLDPVLALVVERPRTDGYPVRWKQGDD